MSREDRRRRWIGVLSLAWLAVGAAGFLSFHLADAGGYLLAATTWSSLPLLALLLAAERFLTPARWRKTSSYEKWLLTPLLAGLLALAAAGALLFLNAATGPGEIVRVEGQVVDARLKNDGGFHTRRLTVRTPAGESLRLGVDAKDFERFPVGAAYAEDWRRGGLGLLYRRTGWLGE